MATKDSQVLKLAQAGQDMADKTAQLKALGDQFLRENSSEALDWGNLAASNPNTLDADGYIQGFDFTPAELSNWIGSLSNLLDESSGWWSTNGGNVTNMTSKPIQ